MLVLHCIGRFVGRRVDGCRRGVDGDAGCESGGAGDGGGAGGESCFGAEQRDSWDDMAEVDMS